MCLLDEMMVLGQWEYLTQSTAISREGRRAGREAVGKWLDPQPSLFTHLLLIVLQRECSYLQAVVPCCVRASSGQLGICLLFERWSSAP